MNSRVYNFDLNLSVPGSTEIPAMAYVQGDTGVNGMNIRLLEEEAQPMDLTGCLVTVIAKRSDGHLSEKMLIKENAVNGKVAWEMEKADVSVPGPVSVTVQVYDGYDARLTSEDFEYEVTAALSGDEAAAASTDYDLYINARHCGDYSDTARYFMNNIVTYAGATYMALRDTEGNAPTDTAYWALVADRGGPGPGMIWKGEYQSETSYQIADGVSYEGSSYICIQACTGQTPGAESEYWELFAEKGDQGPAGEVTHTGTVAAGDIAKFTDSSGEVITPATPHVDYAPPPVTISATLTAAGWSGGEQTINDAAIYSADCPGDLKVAQSASDSAFEAWVYGMIRVTGQGVGSITFKAIGDIPAIDIPIEIEV